MGSEMCIRDSISMCLLSLTTLGPACPVTWRPPNRGEIVRCSRYALYAFWDLSPSLLAASFRSGCRTVVILCLHVCLVCFPSFCLSPPIPLAFVRSGDRTVTISHLLGSFSVYPPFCHRRFRLPPYIQAVESRLYCCLLYTSPSPRDLSTSRMPSSA